MAKVKFRFAPAKERSPQSRQEAEEYGVTGEQIATRYLEEQGWVILERNYHGGGGEVDIVALDGGELVVVEVKRRSKEDLFSAEAAVDHQKRKRLVRVANNYVRRNLRKEPVRFDIIAITGSGEEMELRHTKDAFNVLNL